MSIGNKNKPSIMGAAGFNGPYRNISVKKTVCARTRTK